MLVSRYSRFARFFWVLPMFRVEDARVGYDTQTWVEVSYIPKWWRESRWHPHITLTHKLRWSVRILWHGVYPNESITMVMAPSWDSVRLNRYGFDRIGRPHSGFARWAFNHSRLCNLFGWCRGPFNRMPESCDSTPDIGETVFNHIHPIDQKDIT